MEQFKTLAELMAWAKKEYPGRSFSVRHLEKDLWMIVVKGQDPDGRNRVLRQVVYIRR